MEEAAGQPPQQPSRRLLTCCQYRAALASCVGLRRLKPLRTPRSGSQEGSAGRGGPRRQTAHDHAGAAPEACEKASVAARSGAGHRSQGAPGARRWVGRRREALYACGTQRTAARPALPLRLQSRAHRARRASLNDRPHASRSGGSRGGGRRARARAGLLASPFQKRNEKRDPEIGRTSCCTGFFVTRERPMSNTDLRHPDPYLAVRNSSPRGP